MIDYIKESSPNARAVAGIDQFAGLRLRRVVSFFLASLAALIIVAAISLRALSLPLDPGVLVILGVVIALISRVPGVDISNTDTISIPLIPHMNETAVHLPGALGVWNGILLFCLVSYAFVKVLNVYVRSNRYVDLAYIERGQTGLFPHFAVQEIYAAASSGDLVGAFLASDEGFLTAVRSGVGLDSLKSFQGERPRATDYRDRPGVASITNFASLAEFIARDPHVALFLQSSGVTPEEFRRAAVWVARERATKDVHNRYWGRAALSESPPMADELAYGFGTYLKRFASEFTGITPRLHEAYGGEEVSRMEALLAREAGANVLLVAPSIELGIDIVKDFARDIVYHFPHPALLGKKCFVVDTQMFIESAASREEFEGSFVRIAADAITAGNVILVIDDLAALYVRADQLGADLDAVLRKILASPLATIFLVEESGQAHVIRSHPGMLDHMHEIKIKEAGDDALCAMLESEASVIEKQSGVLITVPAVARVAADAARTRVQGLLSVRAKEILHEIPGWAARADVHVVLAKHVDDLVSISSGMPVGHADLKERELLLTLEARMQEHVVGQTHAIEAVAAALRRARSGVREESKPMASFLFLGPTGVGKTEVAKTLAATYFGGKAAMQRLDMSEYSSPGSLIKLIGDESNPGLLTIAVREHPYGVLLLDEFEKAERSVHDLFLQVLDEGVYHDGKGEAINCRNLIIIATSNAGSREIRLAMAGGAMITADVEKSIIDAIIASGVYRPELMNRFDGTILFTPLSITDYRKIARLMLEKLARQIEAEHRVLLVIDDALVDRVLSSGVDVDFGARPLARAIQELVSNPIAERMLSERIPLGSEIRL